MKVFTLSLSLLLLLCLSPQLYAQSDKHAPGANEVVELEVQPTPKNMRDLASKIAFPKKARDSGIEGRVVFRVLIDERGNYVKHKVMRSPHDMLTNACAKHIHILKFTPGILDGKPIPVWVTVPFDFKIEDEKDKKGKKK